MNLKNQYMKTINLLLIAALFSAGLKDAVVLMIENNMVDAVVSTGANIVDQDFFEALGFRHYQGTPHVDDQQLRELANEFDGSIQDVTGTLVNSGYARGQEVAADASARLILEIQVDEGDSMLG